ncbi:DNA-dependent RNA polymerase auxiliary subunit epsilon [Bhargavaea ginsengi]|jgi:DNA-dependent RNA polymerase auxiliary subunit epsilon|uniref:DNA-directed RNA polymerase subunit epsilon n=1 Tax=Bhargavaea ginsengi TaxID=426757 RepID=A0A1H6T2Q0_9BACL|nr:DNA-dependent RNA polymerase subunit epsilon [Bhargavaea ginsengi]MCM3087279.1 DNA-directed RNA polymerase subunit epsilon [Bhargavaea ginsengi]SEI74399.1 DNA-dependent RNA polymerase auxiliary subunit epsilon [Bhargavaea ginsengi]
MIYKVFYQENMNEVPVRENTKSLYVEAESERAVRAALKDRNLYIEFIQLLEDGHLEYEKNSPDFRIEQV